MHRFRVIAVKLSRLPLFNSFVWGELLKSGLRNHHSVVRCTKYFDILNRFRVDHQWDRQTDRQNYDSNSVPLTTRAKQNDSIVPAFKNNVRFSARNKNELQLIFRPLQIRARSFNNNYLQSVYPTIWRYKKCPITLTLS